MQQPSLENLKAKMLGVELSLYQKALALTEFHKLLDYLKTIAAQAPQQPRLLTYEEAKSMVAKKYKLGSTLVTGHKAIYFEEAAKLFARVCDCAMQSSKGGGAIFCEICTPFRVEGHY